MRWARESRIKKTPPKHSQRLRPVLSCVRLEIEEAEEIPKSPVPAINKAVFSRYCGAILVGDVFGTLRCFPLFSAF